MSQHVDQCIGFLGAGRMATALAQGFLNAGITAPDKLFAADVYPEARERFTAETGVKAVGANRDVVTSADILFLSVKPQHMHGVLNEIADVVTQRHLIVSIAAGVPLAKIGGILGADRRLVRVMPNTPCLVKASASAFAMGGAAGDEDAALIERMLTTVGLAVRVPESQLDAVTGLSGSGPAYVYQIIEAMSDGGVRVGLPRDVATRLAAQTVLGAAKMVLETGMHPGLLKDAVTSPGGTTIAGLHALEQGGLRGLLIDAVVAATERSRELAQSS